MHGSAPSSGSANTSLLGPSCSGCLLPFPVPPPAGAPMAPKGPAASPKLPPSAPPTSLPVPGSREAMAECSTRPPRVPCEKGAKPQRAQGETHVLPTSCCPCPEDRGAFLQNKRLPCQSSGHGTGLDRLILQQRQLYVPPEQLPTRPHSRALSRAVFLPPRQSAGPAGHQAAKPLRSTLPQRPSGDWGRLEVRCRPRGSTSRSGSAQSQTCLTGGIRPPPAPQGGHHATASFSLLHPCAEAVSGAGAGRCCSKHWQKEPGQQPAGTRGLALCPWRSAVKPRKH